jgi:hypothetical protein
MLVSVGQSPTLIHRGSLNTNVGFMLQQLLFANICSMHVLAQLSLTLFVWVCGMQRYSCFLVSISDRRSAGKKVTAVHTTTHARQVPVAAPLERRCRRCPTLGGQPAVVIDWHGSQQPILKGNARAARGGSLISLGLAERRGLLGGGRGCRC